MDHIQITGVSKIDNTGASALNKAIDYYKNLHENSDVPGERKPTLDPKIEENSFHESAAGPPVKEIWSLSNLEVTIGQGSGQKSNSFSIPMEEFEDYCLDNGFAESLLQKLVSKGPMFEHHFVFPEGSRTPSHLEIAMATFENDCFFFLFRYDIVQRNAVCLIFIKTIDYPKDRATFVDSVINWLQSCKGLLSRHPLMILSVVLSFMQSRAHEFLRIRLDLYNMESRLGVTRKGQLLIERGYGEVCYDFGLLNADLAGLSKQIADTELSASTMMEFARSIERIVETCEDLEASLSSSPGKKLPVSEPREEIRSTITRAELYLKQTKMAQAILQSLAAVLYNRINKQDTDAVKMIAVVTLVFLPATFVSAVFSTGIFNFHASEPPEKLQTISKYGWVYLLVCILSTGFTLLAWVCWYRWGRYWMEKREFNKIQTPQKQNVYALSNPQPFQRKVNAFPISTPNYAYMQYPPRVPRQNKVIR